MKGKLTASKIIALGILSLDAICTCVVLYFCYLAIRSQFTAAVSHHADWSAASVHGGGAGGVFWKEQGGEHPRWHHL